MDDLSRFCCLNSECPEYGKRGVGNLTVTSRYGPHKERRMLRCNACKARFSERKGTPLFDTRLPPEKVESVLEHGKTHYEGQVQTKAGKKIAIELDAAGTPIKK